MATSLVDKTVGAIVAERPRRSEVFERYGIDYCCKGSMTLEDACGAKSVPVADVLSDLDKNDQLKIDSADMRVAGLTITELADQIEQTHHAYLKEALPRLSFLIDKVTKAHGEHNPNLHKLREVYAAFRLDLEAHTAKEERILFPLIRDIDLGATDRNPMCGHVSDPIRVMESEHDGAGEALGLMKSLTDDYTAPIGACNTYRAMLQGLSDLELETHTHIHKENSILFPKAIAAESVLLAGATA